MGATPPSSNSSSPPVPLVGSRGRPLDARQPRDQRPRSGRHHRAALREGSPLAAARYRPSRSCRHRSLPEAQGEAPARRPRSSLARRARAADRLGHCQVVRTRGEQAGIAGLHPHLFRHLFAHWGACRRRHRGRSHANRRLALARHAEPLRGLNRRRADPRSVAAGEPRGQDLSTRESVDTHDASARCVVPCGRIPQRCTRVLPAEASPGVCLDRSRTSSETVDPSRDRARGRPEWAELSAQWRSCPDRGLTA